MATVALGLMILPLACGKETKTDLPSQKRFAADNETGEHREGQGDPSVIEIKGIGDAASKGYSPAPEPSASPAPSSGGAETDSSNPLPSASPAIGSPFTDLAADPRRLEIGEAFRRGIVTGRTPTLFEPDASLAREELAAIIYNALEDFQIALPREQSSQAQSFQDVDPQRWSARAIETLASLGIMGGTSKGVFEPEQSVTRAQVVVAVWGAVQRARSRVSDQSPLPVVVARRSYADTSGHWAEARIAEMSGFCHADEGTETDADSFRPNRLSSRSHATGVIIRALDCFETGKLPVWVTPGLPSSPTVTPSPSGPTPTDDVLRLCESSVVAERQSALESLRRLNFGARTLNFAAMPKSHERCVLELLPGALYTNLKTGVPASILMGQAIQETGWCASELSLRGRNFHGQKAKFDVSNFTYWKGATIDIFSSESPTGGGRVVKSRFMAFSHPDHSFYSVAERLKIPGLPYQSCMARRSDTVGFIRCVGKSWAVHADYADLVLEHRAQFRAPSRPALRLGTCDLKVSEWALAPAF